MSLTSPSPPLRELTGRQIQWIGAGYAMCFSSMAGQTIFIAQFNTAIRETFGLTHGSFGGLYTAATLASSILLVFAGGFADKIAPRNLAIFCLVGLGTMALGMSVAGHVVLLGFLLFGLRFFGQGMMTHIASTMAARWFTRFRGRALAFVQLGTPTGDAILPLSLTLAIAAFGWRQVWFTSALVLILILVPIIFVLLRDPPDGKKALARGDVNPDGNHGAALTGTKWTRSAVLKDPLFYLVVPGLMGPPAIGTLYLFHQANLSEIKGWDLTVFTAFFPVLAGMSILISVVAGTLVDRFGAWRMMPFILVPLGLACITVATLSPVWSIPLFFALVGSTMGMTSPIVGAFWPEVYGTTHIGAIRALAVAALVFASAVGPGIAGYLIDAGISLETQSFFYSGYCFIGAIAYVALTPLFARRARLITEAID